MKRSVYVKRRISLVAVSVLAVLVLSGCGVLNSSRPTPTIVPLPDERLVRARPSTLPVQTPTPAPTETPLPSFTPTPIFFMMRLETPSPTPTPTNTPLPPTTPPFDGPRAEVVARSVNVREKPRFASRTLGYLERGETVGIVGVSAESDWLRIVYPASPDGLGWIPSSGRYVRVIGSLEAVPLISTSTPTRATESPIPAALIAFPPGGIKAEVVVRALHVREGPGVDYPSLGHLSQGDVVEVVGVNADSSWLQIVYPASPDGLGWISGREQYVHLSGSLEKLPDVRGTPQPSSSARPELPGKLVFQTSSGGDIYIINADGTGLKRLTYGLDPALSPDGTQVAFARWSWSSDGRGPGLYIINADGSGDHLLLGVEWPKAPTWSPDGTRLAFTRQHGGHRDHWWKCREIREKRVCFRMLPDPHWKLGTVRLEDGYLHEPHCHDFSYSPSWSPDGETIIYASDKGLYYTSEKAEQAVVTEPSKGAISRDIRDRSPAWSPDGTRIAFQYRSSDHYEIMVMNADGSGRRALTKTPLLADRPVNSVAPAWSPGGQHIVFLTDRGGEWKLYVMNADGSDQRPMFETALDGPKFEYYFVDERVVSWGR